MTDGGNVVTEGLGSMTVVSQGYGYVPRAMPVSGSIRPAMQELLDGTIMLKLRQEVADAFTSLRMEYGEEVTVEALFSAIDKTILAQPNVYDKSKLQSLSPNSVAVIAYKEV